LWATVGWGRWNCCERTNHWQYSGGDC
jgi:hypothetical protein